MRQHLLIALLFLSACDYDSPLPKPTPAEIADQANATWMQAYTLIANRYTERTYGCIVEMYSLAYDPVDSGPVCRDSCDLMKQVNSAVDAAPKTIADPDQYRLAPSKVCTPKPKPRAHRARAGTR